VLIRSDDSWQASGLLLRYRVEHRRTITDEIKVHHFRSYGFQKAAAGRFLGLFRRLAEAGPGNF
jgi:hypothetical protein